MNKFIFKNTPIKDLMVIEATSFKDDRGFFMEYYNKDEFAKYGLKTDFVQDNLSFSKKGVIRGLHYQINPAPMGKLVKVIKGSIFDVGVDIRQGSPTFGKWFGEILSEKNHKMLYLPPGFAHGFLSLEDDTSVIYKCTGMYSPKNERAIAWDDSDIGIKWPIDNINHVIISEKDKNNPKLIKAEMNFKY